MTEQQLRSQMEQNTAQGQSALFETYYNYVYAIVYRRVQAFGTREDVEECVIDVFTEVMRHYSDIRNGSLKAYIASTAHNKAINTCRALSADKRQTLSLDSEEYGELASAQDVEEETEKKELTRRLLDCIESLGKPDSAIIIQKYYLGRNAIEIGSALHMNPVTVRSRLYRTVKRLKTMLTDMGISL